MSRRKEEPSSNGGFGRYIKIYSESNTSDSVEKQPDDAVEQQPDNVEKLDPCMRKVTTCKESNEGKVSTREPSYKVSMVVEGVKN